MPPLTRLQDSVTKFSFYVACACMLAILVIMNSEIVLRYFLNAPTKWSADLVTYLLLVAIALGLPEVTRVRGHIAITIVGEHLRTASARKTVDFFRSVATLAIVGATGAIILVTATKEFQSGVQTVAAFQIPKWLLNGVLAYGFLSSAAYLLRHAAAPTDQQHTSAAEGAIE